MLAEQFKSFLLDLDGVVYVGDQALPGSVEAIARLREQGKNIRFLTNDPRSTRAGIVERLQRLGVEAQVGEVVTCGWATGVFLREHARRRVYVVGSEGLRRELTDSGVTVVDDGSADAVVVGCDERITYVHIRDAARLIRAGALFVATNDDATFPTPEGPAPATGAIVAAVQVASARAPQVIGKPHGQMFTAALQGLDSRSAVMIGDTLATDILGARLMGISALLLHDQVHFRPPDEALQRPDLVIRSLADIFDSSYAMNV